MLLERLRSPVKKPRLWLRLLITGFALWVITIIVLQITELTTLIPSVIFLGAFLSPLTFAVWLYEREQFSGAAPDGSSTALSLPLLAAGFAGAGILGVVLSGLLETVILNRLPLILWYAGVAVIEESVKIALVWVLARNLTRYTLRDGMVLGACVGFGFAAFESAGYAFNTLLKADDQNLLSVVETQLVRGLLTPVGHGLWTALLAGALFAAAGKYGRLRLTWSVVGWWLVVVGLHWAWDASTGLATVLAIISTGDPASLADFESGKLPNPTDWQVHLQALYSWLLLMLWAVLGFALANRMWVKGRAVVPGYPYGPTVDDGTSVPRT
ncbi:MAG: PrsW family intramembrane metalloprotease [Actinobacteria bacterium]|nr:PrsW family intramembrane metalloprotease [Actinomycetota bacterium]